MFSLLDSVRCCENSHCFFLYPGTPVHGSALYAIVPYNKVAGVIPVCRAFLCGVFVLYTDLLLCSLICFR